MLYYRVEADRYKKYLESRQIEDAEYELTENKIHITSKNTVWINLIREIEISKEGLLQYIELIEQKVKETGRGTKLVGNRKARQHINEIYDTYKETYNNLVKLFNEVLCYCYAIEKIGINYGASDDFLLKKVTEITVKMYKLRYDTPEYVSICSINRHLKKLVQTECWNHDIEKLILF